MNYDRLMIGVDNRAAGRARHKPDVTTNKPDCVSEQRSLPERSIKRRWLVTILVRSYYPIVSSFVPAET